MNRRNFAKLSALLPLALSAGCQRDSSRVAAGNMVGPLPPFSRDRLHAQLDTLRAAYEEQGLMVSESLLPPVSEAELAERCDWFPGDMTPELSALYGWHEGQEKGAWEVDFPFWFRDCAFLRLDNAQREYRSMMTSYGLLPPYRGLLKYSFPFAAFDGNWFVIPTRGQDLDDSLAMPVISVGEGVDIYFYSIELMIKTCIDWVSHPDYNSTLGLTRDVEIEIWQKHNPGIFGL